MKRNLFVLLWLLGLLAAGYGLGMWQQGMTWTADQELLETYDIVPAPLPNPVSGSEPLVSGPVRSSADAVDAAVPQLRFQPLPDTGINFAYDNGPEGLFHLAETLGGGVAAVDFDRDGNMDIAFVDGGHPVKNIRGVAGSDADESTAQNRVVLYRHGDGMKFADVSATAELLWTGYGHGCAVADVNSDGFDDFLITGYQSSTLFLNLGDGTFVESDVLTDLTTGRWCATAAFADLDGDSDLDVYITCYTDTPASLTTPVCTSAGQRIHCHPHVYNGVPDLLLENQGDGRFADRSEASGIARFSEYGLGVCLADLNRDGQPEIFVANDGDRNLLFEATGSWQYQEIALASGVAYNGQGEAMGSMGIACADIDRNGWLDLVTTNFAFERNVVFSNLGALAFVDESQGTPVDHTSRPSVGWSVLPLDANRDGYVDLFVANGHVTQMPSEPWQQSPLLFAGTAAGLQISGDGGPYFQQPWHGRGACRVDLDNDGRDDLVVSHIDDPASLLKNDSSSLEPFLSLRLIGRNSARTAEASLVEVATPELTAVYPYSRNAGYLSSNSDVLTVAAPTSAAAVTIYWASGFVQPLSLLPGNCRVTVIEGRPPVVMAER